MILHQPAYCMKDGGYRSGRRLQAAEGIAISSNIVEWSDQSCLLDNFFARHEPLCAISGPGYRVVVGAYYIASRWSFSSFFRILFCLSWDR